MNIENYTSYFHDGSIIDIKHSVDSMVISMESAEMDEEDLTDDITLSADDRIKGKLHIEGIKSIKENGKSHTAVFKMKHEDASIFHLKINQNQVELQIAWNTYPPTSDTNDFSTMEIKAEQIYWENIPNLVDPKNT